MFTYRSRFLTRGEVWFDETPDGAPVDWIYHRQRSSPLARVRRRSFYTVLVDLRKTASEMFEAMEAKTARKIAEAQEKDKLKWERYESKDARILDEVERMWNDFARAQKTPLLERDWLEPMRAADLLHLSAARDTAGQVLAYHLVLLTPKRARQLIAISPYRAVPDVAWRGAVSRANCFIHWRNFQSFHAQGIPWFDFGGWYPGRTNIQYLGINRFKMSLGGKVVLEYDCDQPVTLKGRVLLAAAEALARVKRARLSVQGGAEGRAQGEPAAERDASPAFR